MKVEFSHLNKQYFASLCEPHDISIPLKSNSDNVTAWYVGAPVIKPVVGENFIGSVQEGSAVNFREIFFNPHGHGTHTECVGHINKAVTSINKTLKNFHFFAALVTVTPEVVSEKEGTREKGDLIIQKYQLEATIENYKPEAIIIRTLPNSKGKLNRQYSNTNPPYICHEAMKYLVQNGVKHFLIDLPSVDKEVDNGELLAHKAFWNYPEHPNYERTITELIYVDDYIIDGLFLLNLQIAPFENDASPSKPVIYRLEERK